MSSGASMFHFSTSHSVSCCLLLIENTVLVIQLFCFDTDANSIFKVACLLKGFLIGEIKLKIRLEFGTRMSPEDQKCVHYLLHYLHSNS
jgi:hypothetical protein